MAENHSTQRLVSVSPMTNIGVPRTVSDDETTEYPQAKRRREIDASKIERGMEIDHSFASIPNLLPSQDDVLMEMIQQSGAQSYAEIVSFCIESGIPLSRMFCLDLMRKAHLSHQ